MNGNSDGWSSPQIVASFVAGALLLAAFVAWELRTAEPMLPMRFFRDRAFSAANGASLFMYFGMFGSIFLLTQFFQTAQGYSPLESGLRVLPWTAMPMVVAPIAGALSDRIGGRPFMVLGLALQSIGLAWIALVTEPTAGYSSFVGPFIISGIGMGMFFAPVANVVLSAVRRQEEGKASGANNAIREVGGVLGVAVLASVFAHAGGYGTPETFTDGLVPGARSGCGRRGRRLPRLAAHPAQAPLGRGPAWVRRTASSSRTSRLPSSLLTPDRRAVGGHRAGALDRGAGPKPARQLGTVAP